MGNSTSAKGKLYPQGSTEGTPPPNAGDPLGWMPPKLRSRVATVDTATTTPEQQRAMMEAHAAPKPKLQPQPNASGHSAETTRALKAARTLLPSEEEINRIAQETDPQQFLADMRML